ncbi:hypothetical protein Cgig2_026827 [Carnegiea gigantea]|uniref:Uncharacterized protein n=1 Tax=Carnegiea gigantea TaxID=171969 RepID=A0A9Q1QQ20_9CARY|nr:hypothetical protein Cgig2_026827 [Carnegiea gigantea]
MAHLDQKVPKELIQQVINEVNIKEKCTTKKWIWGSVSVIVALGGWFGSFDLEKPKIEPLGIGLRNWAMFVLIVVVSKLVTHRILSCMVFIEKYRHKYQKRVVLPSFSIYNHSPLLLKRYFDEDIELNHPGQNWTSSFWEGDRGPQEVNFRVLRKGHYNETKVIDGGKIEQLSVDNKAPMWHGVQLQIVNGKISRRLLHGPKLKITYENIAATTAARIILNIVRDKTDRRS